MSSSLSISELNALPDDRAFSIFKSICGSTEWSNQMNRKRPYTNLAQLKHESSMVWHTISKDDHLEAVMHHPRIGSKKKDDMSKFGTLEKEFFQKEFYRPDRKEMTEDVKAQLAEGNRIYEEKFGYIFLVFASGKSDEQILELLKERVHNHPEDEFVVTCAEEEKVILKRVQDIFRDDSVAKL